MKEKIYILLPHFFQNIIITIFNILAYRKRYGGKYKYYLSLFKKNRTLTREELNTIQENRFSYFINYAVSKSIYYKELLSNVKEYDDVRNIKNLPIINKEALRVNSNSIYNHFTKKQVFFQKQGVQRVNH